MRVQLDLQRGAVLAVELKNNSAKIARWATCALLAGAHQASDAGGEADDDRC
jgi:translation initiation factor 3 subunit D